MFSRVNWLSLAAAPQRLCLVPESFNMNPRGFLRAISGAGPRNAQNQPPEASWEPFREQGSEMLKISLQGLPENHFGSRQQKRSKSASRSFLRAISGTAFGSSWLALAATSQEIHGLSHFWRENTRFSAKVPWICPLYERNLRLPSILTAFL